MLTVGLCLHRRPAAANIQGMYTLKELTAFNAVVFLSLVSHLLTSCDGCAQARDVLTLKLGSFKAPRGEKSGQVLSLDWLPQKPHNIVAVGFFDGASRCPAGRRWLIGSKRTSKFPPAGLQSWGEKAKVAWLILFIFCSSSGVVGLWDLNTTSALLRVREPDKSLSLLPYQNLLAHDHAVRALAFCPASRYLPLSSHLQRRHPLAALTMSEE